MEIRGYGYHTSSLRLGQHTGVWIIQFFAVAPFSVKSLVVFVTAFQDPSIKSISSIKNRTMFGAPFLAGGDGGVAAHGASGSGGGGEGECPGWHGFSGSGS